MAAVKVTLNEYRDQLEKAVDEQNFVLLETMLNTELEHTINMSTNTTIGATNTSVIVR